MENRYWIGRNQKALTMARSAVSAEARLIHYDLAGRYSVMAAQSAAIAAARERRQASGEMLELRAPAGAPAPVAGDGERS